MALGWDLASQISNAWASVPPLLGMQKSTTVVVPPAIAHLPPLVKSSLLTEPMKGMAR